MSHSILFPPRHEPRRWSRDYQEGSWRYLAITLIWDIHNSPHYSVLHTLDGTFDVAYILNRSSDKNVPQHYIRLADSSSKRLTQLVIDGHTRLGLGPAAGIDWQQQGESREPQAFQGVSSHTPVEREEERCLICNNTGGRLLLCDFPQCERTYHHVCIFKTGPPVLDFADTDFDLDASFTATDSWFCPAHTCFNCAVFQESACPMSAMELPAAWLSSSNSLKRQQPLKTCVSCPLAACADCIAEIGKSCHVFDSKRKEQVYLRQRFHNQQQIIKFI